MVRHALLRPLALAAATLCLTAGLGARDLAALTPGELATATPASAADGFERRLLEDSRLERLYRPHGFQPIWLDAGRGGLDERGVAVLAALDAADEEGLDPTRYHVAEIAAARAAGDWEALDLLVSAGLLRYADDLLHGREELRQRGAKHDIDGTPRDPLEAVRDLAVAEDAAVALAGLAPDHPQYDRLRRTLAELRERVAAGGWPRVPEGETLDPGMRDPRVASLRERLAATQQLEPDGAADPQLYDPALERAVRTFQRRSGLAVDGRVGPNTLAALNRSAAELVEVVQANLERWRWLPNALGPRYLLVNTPGYELRAVDGGREVLRMAVVAGQPSRATPLFSAEMTYLEANPTWTVPPTIFAEDYLPKLREDPGYLAKKRITLYASWSSTATPVDPYAVDWHAVRASSRNLPYRLVQSPGPHNALGRLKFMMPNRHTIYLHDTNQPELFKRSRRALSSGCVRVARPDDLARLTLQDAPGWDMQRLEATYASGRTTRVPLERPWPVHMTYFTVWVDDDGTTHFYDDVYGRDEDLREQLRSRELLLAEEPVRALGRS